MNIVNKKTHCGSANIKSANDLINMQLNFNNGPELLLDDNSILIFENVSDYYNSIMLGAIKDNEVNLDILELTYDKISDDVAEYLYENIYTIIEIEKYTDGKINIYRFITA